MGSKWVVPPQEGAAPVRGGLLTDVPKKAPPVPPKATKPVPVVLESTVLPGAAGKSAKRSEAARARDAAALKADPVRYLAGLNLRALKMREKGCELDSAWLDERLRAGLCEATGATLAGVAGSPRAPMICRRDPRLGWTRENCLVACAQYVAARGPWLEKDFFQFLYATVQKEKLDE